MGSHITEPDFCDDYSSGIDPNALKRDSTLRFKICGFLAAKLVQKGAVSAPRKGLDKEWIDQHSKKRFRITTLGHCGSRQTARVKTYGDVVTEYEFKMR